MIMRRRLLLAALPILVLGVALAGWIQWTRSSSPEAVAERYISATAGDAPALQATSLAGREEPHGSVDALLTATHSPRRPAPVAVIDVVEDEAEAVGTNSRLFVVTGTADRRAFTTRVRVMHYDDVGWRVVAEVP